MESFILPSVREWTSQLSVHWIIPIRTAELTRRRSRSTRIHHDVNWKWFSYPGIKLSLVCILFRVFQVLWALGCWQLFQKQYSIPHVLRMRHYFADSHGKLDIASMKLLLRKKCTWAKRHFMSALHLFEEQWSRKKHFWNKALHGRNGIGSVRCSISNAGFLQTGDWSELADTHAAASVHTNLVFI